MTASADPDAGDGAASAAPVAAPGPDIILGGGVLPRLVPPVTGGRRRGASQASRWLARSPRYDPFGMSVALGFVCLSLTPSLLPRGPALQGCLSGVNGALGYGCGCLLGHVISAVAARLRLPTPTLLARRVAVGCLTLGAAIAIGVFLVASRQWQREAHALVGLPVPGPSSLVLLFAVTVTVFTVLVAVGRIFLAAARVVSGRLCRRGMHPRTAGVAGVAVVALTSGMFVDQVVLRAAVAAVDQVFSAVNDGTEPGVHRPVSPLRSGSPASLVGWDDLGLQGRTFVARAPAAGQISRATGRAAIEPIRVYVGLDAPTTPAEPGAPPWLNRVDSRLDSTSIGSERERDIRNRARTAVAELERTGAFDRAVLCVVTTTGTGWVDPHAARALEYLHGGDTAIVAMQYSYLPSPLSFLFDDREAERAGAELFNQVHARWLAQPADRRPRLLVFGESLGSNGGQAAFGDLAAIQRRADGALFAGPPATNQLWRAIVDDRDPGSPEHLPVYRRGETVRFADDREDLQPLSGEGSTAWSRPRVLFLQHASDPVVWWSPDLLFTRPDWLSEPRGGDVSPSMSWYPVVTFWQVTSDLIHANQVPPGAGHRYHDISLDAWAAIAPPDGWTHADTEHLRQWLGLGPVS